ncbi:MAG: DUF3604 domain-containing protein [bacterium]|nr:DUF3604 domain-containing protein [bacterium]
MKKILLGVVYFTVGAVLIVAAAYAMLLRGTGGDYISQPQISRTARDPLSVSRSRATQVHAGASADRQILFGDLHVHTTWSSDAFLFSLPLIQGEGAHPPADACDFARHCSALDFWSINDHAEMLTPEQWRETIASIRECNEVSGGGSDPDLVSLLGWEWTQMGSEPENHYGHKNVILRGIGAGEVPTRPIGAGQNLLNDAIAGMGPMRVALPVLDRENFSYYMDFNRWVTEAMATPLCEEGVPVRELPENCIETARTPGTLFAKLDDWGFDNLVIPHGTSWGIHSPALSSLASQMGTGGELSERQPLFEVFSGHGNSERYGPFAALTRDQNGELVCPEPSDGYEPCCHRAGILARRTCADPESEECADRVRRVRDDFIAGSYGSSRFHLIPGATPEDWGECGQLPGGFMPAFMYRPMMSAQYGLALGAFGEGREPGRYRYGLIGSSDNHKARAGTGYKEFGRKAMTDAWGIDGAVLERLEPDPEVLAAEREKGTLALDEVRPLTGFMPERGASFYYTGGLVAAHAEGRGRDALFDSLVRREVYGTSGDRILLWFDLLLPDGTSKPMGSEFELSENPRFEVRAVGSFEQKPGCPQDVVSSLGRERTERLCLGECYFPSDTRNEITRIEVVRIRPQKSPDEPVAPLIEDPWRILPCSDTGGGCRVEFEDPDFSHSGRETIYYVRAIQEAKPMVAGDPLRCDRDERGQCIRPRPCYANGPKFDPGDECLDEVEPRAWSSPIFLTQASN